MNFQTALATHLAAIQTRDLAAFEATLTTGADCTLILPNGHLIEGRTAVLDFHREWFADPDWRLVLQPLRQIETVSTGLALFEVTYHDLDADGQPYELRYYLSLLFVNEAGEWRLVHDQNTLSPGE